MIFTKMTALMLAVGMFWNVAYAGNGAPAKTAKKLDINAEAMISANGDFRGELTRGLQDEKVLKELARLGVDKKEVQTRMAAMSDRELLQVKQGVQRQAGGDVVILSVTTLLVIIILILILK